MQKKRDLIYRHHLDKNIELFRNKPIDGKQQVLKSPIQRVTPEYSYYQDQNRLWYQKHADKPVFQQKQIKPCNFHSSTYKSYFGHENKNIGNESITVFQKLTNNIKQEIQTKEKRKSSIEKDKQTSTGSKQLNMRHDQVTPTFSLIEDQNDTKEHFSQNKKEGNIVYLSAQQKAVQNKHLAVDKMNNNFKHRRHNSQQYQRNFSNIEISNRPNDTLIKENKLQNYGQKRQNHIDAKLSAIDDLKARLQKQLQKNEQLDYRCKKLLESNQQLKKATQLHKNAQLLKQNHKIQAQLAKWRKLINFSSNNDHNAILPQKKHSNSFQYRTNKSKQLQ